MNSNAAEDQISFYSKQWIKFEKLTSLKLNEEYNIKVNKRWKDNIKSNPKRLWDLIDWNNSKKKKTETPRINSNVVNNYFTNIFRSNRIINNPIVENIIASVNRYTFYVPLLDDKFSPSEFNDAINEIGKATGIDGLDPK